MPLNMNDPYLRAERQPPSIVALGVRLKQAYRVGADNFGIKGNEYHYSGYHRSWNFLKRSNLGNGGDYSTNGTLNHGGNENNNCAFDFTPGVWGSTDNRAKMIVLTKRLRKAARANDPRLASYYEFAGTEDGKHVVTFYAQGGNAKDPFDPTHLDHIHGSKYRSRSDNDDTGLGDVLLGIGSSTGEDDDDMGATYMNGQIPLTPDSRPYNIDLGIVEGGAADPRQAWIGFTNDTGKNYKLRIFATKGEEPSNYFVLSFGGVASQKDGVVEFKPGIRGWTSLPPGVVALSVLRADDYTGPIGFAVERGPVIK